MNTLVEAAAQVFAREGVATTTNRIAERAGLSIGTLYQYYPDKLALLRAVAERHVRFEERICDEVSFHLKRCDRGGDDTELTARTLVHTIDAHLHRVLEFDIDALMVTVDRLAPPPG